MLVCKPWELSFISDPSANADGSWTYLKTQTLKAHSGVSYLARLVCFLKHAESCGGHSTTLICPSRAALKKGSTVQSNLKIVNSSRRYFFSGSCSCPNDARSCSCPTAHTSIYTAPF